MLTSVAICTYNGERFLAAQLDSILNQNIPVDEIIICDDCSTDKTIDIITNAINNFGTKILLVQNETNLGAIYAFEKCIKACNGDIIFLSDQDDIWLPDKVEKFLKLFESDNSAYAAFSNGALIDGNNISLNSTLWKEWKFDEQLRIQWLNNKFVFSELLDNRNKITGATVAFRKDLKRWLLPFEIPLGYWHDSWIGLIASGMNGLRFIDESTILYRVHQHQQVGITGGYDKKYKSISKEVFKKNVKEKFPHHEYIIYPNKNTYFKMRNFIRRVFGKIRYTLKF